MLPSQLKVADENKHRAITELCRFMNAPELEKNKMQETASANRALGPYLDALKALGKFPIPSADLHGVSACPPGRFQGVPISSLACYPPVLLVLMRSPTPARALVDRCPSSACPAL